MKKTMGLFLTLCIILGCLIGCSAAQNTPDSGETPSSEPVTQFSNETPSPETVDTPIEWIRPDDSINLDGMNVYWQFDGFQFAADENARIILYVRTDINSDGALVFDDGQDWLLVMETSLGNFALFQRQYVQLGKVSCTVYNAMNEESNQYDMTHVLITVAQTASYRIYDCIFDNEQKAFRMEPVYDAQNINFMGNSV